MKGKTTIESQLALACAQVDSKDAFKISFLIGSLISHFMNGAPAPTFVLTAEDLKEPLAVTFTREFEIDTITIGYRRIFKSLLTLEEMDSVGVVRNYFDILLAFAIIGICTRGSRKTDFLNPKYLDALEWQFVKMNTPIDGIRTVLNHEFIAVYVKLAFKIIELDYFQTGLNSTILTTTPIANNLFRSVKNTRQG